MYAENCGWEKPQYWEDKIISSWNDSWGGAYKQYQSRVNLPDSKYVNRVTKIIRGPW